MLWDKHNKGPKKVINTAIFLVVTLTTRHSEQHGRHGETWVTRGSTILAWKKTTGGERVPSPVVADEESCGKSLLNGLLGEEDAFHVDVEGGVFIA